MKVSQFSCKKDGCQLMNLVKIELEHEDGNQFILEVHCSECGAALIQYPSECGMIPVVPLATRTN